MELKLRDLTSTYRTSVCKKRVSYYFVENKWLIVFRVSTYVDPRPSTRPNQSQNISFVTGKSRLFLKWASD